MSEELEVLKIVTQRLENAGIPYMLTGSIAANFYTVPRMTRDIDIVVELEPSDAEKVHRLFSGDFYIDQETVKAEVARRGIFNIIHTDYIIKVDFIVKKESEYRQTEFERRRPVQIEDTRFFLVAPEDLILSKLDWAKENRSETQLGDVKNLLVSVKVLDDHYLNKWASELGLADLLEEVRE